MNRLTFSRLSDLIRICKVREDSYNKAYDSFSHTSMSFIFKKYANESRLFAAELERYITKYPSKQEDEYDHFVEYKWNKMIGHLPRKNVAETIQECIECEIRTIAFFESFLKDYPSLELKMKIVKQLNQIEKSQDILHKFQNYEETQQLLGKSEI